MLVSTSAAFAQDVAKHPRPALIPMPRQLVWKDTTYYLGTPIEVNAPIHASENVRDVAIALTNSLAKAGARVLSGSDPRPRRLDFLDLKIGEVSGADGNDEAYHLDASGYRITLTAPSTSRSSPAPSVVSSWANAFLIAGRAGEGPRQPRLRSAHGSASCYRPP